MRRACGNIIGTIPKMLVETLVHLLSLGVEAQPELSSTGKNEGEGKYVVPNNYDDGSGVYDDILNVKKVLFFVGEDGSVHQAQAYLYEYQRCERHQIRARFRSANIS